MNALAGAFAQEEALADAAIATLAAFRAARDAGTLDRRQYSALLALEDAAEPFALAAAEAAEIEASDAGGPSPAAAAWPDMPGAHPACPAADLTAGDDRHGGAMGRPGA